MFISSAPAQKNACKIFHNIHLGSIKSNARKQKTYLIVAMMLLVNLSSTKFGSKAPGENTSRRYKIILHNLATKFLLHKPQKFVILTKISKTVISCINFHFKIFNLI